MDAKVQQQQPEYDGGSVFLVCDLCNLVESYLSPEQSQEIYRAYLFAASVHNGQRRASGEPYINHPLHVARILAEMRLDCQTIIAALLHDVIEDTPTAKIQIEEEFGAEVTGLVDGVSKLTQISFESKVQEQAENFRRLLLAMAQDIRVILVKLADRLHNMRTLSALSEEKRRRIARETLDIYVPIASRLGLNNLLLELEDLGFLTLHPMRYRVLHSELQKARGNRKKIVKKIEDSIRNRLASEGLRGRVLGREKHVYSIYQKMRTKHLSFAEVFDVFAFRIIVDSVDTCYRVLGAMHNLYKPVPGKFKDYVAIPKENGYQALHSVLFGPYGTGIPVEIQIRTEDMHLVAESGIASHWMYKIGKNKDEQGRVSAAHTRAREWLRSLLDIQQHAANDSVEFMQNVKIDLFPNEVYVFTPAGEIMELPRGASAVDLAYAVHTDVGNTCVAVKIDRRYAPLRTQLVNGQTVEVVTAPWGRPNPNWLNFVVTGKARSNIRNYLKNLRRGEAVELGKRLITQSLASVSLSIEEIPEENISALLADLGLPDFERLLEEVGLGKHVAPLVVRRLAPPRPEDAEELPPGTAVPKKGDHPLYIRGTEGMVVSLAKCCRPIPGDPILGYLTAGRGVVVHLQSCNNLSDFASKPEKWIEVEWSEDLVGEFPVEIRVEAANQKGVLATLAAAIATTGANIENLFLSDRDGLHTALTFVVDVTDRIHLAQIIKRLRNINLVTRIVRTRG